MKSIYAVLLLFMPVTPLAAATAHFQCNGVLPGWSLRVTDGQSVLTTDREIAMDVMDETRAEGDRDWPRALTLVGRNDTAILLVEGDVPAELEEKAQLVVDNCPEFAIELD